MKLRIIVITMLITFAGILAYSVISAEIYYKSSIESTREYLSVYMNAFDGEKYSALNDTAAKDFSDMLDGARVTFISEDGEVLADSQTQEVSENHSDRTEVAQALEKGDGYAVRHSSTVGLDFVYYCRAIDLSSGVVLVRIALPTSSEWAIIGQYLPTIAIYLVIDLLACVAFAYAATYFILRPVENITRQAALSKRITTKNKELLPIAQILNERNADIERKMNEIREEKELVERAQNSKNEFISNITHEMNTPLTSIKGYAELLNSGMLSPEQSATAYKTILSQSERLTNLIACIINYNEIDNADVTPCEVDFSKLVKEMITIVNPEAEKRNVKIIGSISDNVIISSTHERMCALAGNLIRNAIRYNKEGGSVTVSLNRAQFIVSDTGIGISEQDLSKVFSRFFTVDKSHGGKNGGFGLGLAMVKKICQCEGWKITVESKLGVGTTFTVTF